MSVKQKSNTIQKLYLRTSINMKYNFDKK